MAFIKAVLFFGIAAVLAVSAASAAATQEAATDFQGAKNEFIPTKSSIQIVPKLTYIPARCYRRTQICCYRFYVCRRKCVLISCKNVRICTLTVNGVCKKYKIVRVCRYRCYLTYCPRIYCTPFVITRAKTYIAPLSYQRTTISSNSTSA